MSVALKTMAMKARVYNKIRTSLYKKRLEDISKEEKIRMFDEIFIMNHETHWELNNYKQKRQAKAAIHAERVKRGYIFKKKVSKQDYERLKTA